MTRRRILAMAGAYLAVGGLAMAGWWLATRPAGPAGEPASPLAAAQLRAGEPTLEYPRRAAPVGLAGEARATWRAAHLDGWKWRLGQCLDGETADGPPALFPADDRPRAEGFRAGWTAAQTQVEDLVRTLGAAGAEAFVRRKVREEPRLHDRARAVLPPPE